MAWFTKILPKKKIYISELEWEKERERKRIAAERAALDRLGTSRVVKIAKGLTNDGTY